ncbi:calcium-binding protein, partial [Candidatus Babeliales bacterium]|nr:calcium-binding protein [Candidatus Babeliales bacterium]
TGDDTYVVDNVNDSVTELVDEGIDTVESSISYTLNDNVENLTLTGNENIDATGNELDNTIVGNTANNVLDGGLGADTMSGGSGDDTYIVDADTDVVIENTGEGNDSVISDVSYTLTDNVENLTLTGEANLDGTGNNLDNSLTGNTGNNILDGGAGVDTLTGGVGNDTYIIDNTNDVINESANEGIDTAISDVNYALSDNVENLTLTGAADIDGTGNNANNVITSNDGINTLSGLAGNDTYNVNSTDDVVVENIAEGNDTVNSSATYTLSDNIEKLNLTGTENIDGTGNNLNNTITGNSGSNVIDGGAGADSMSGAGGDDTYIVDHSSDRVYENYNAGHDQVYSSVTHSLSSNVEDLTLTGTGNTNGYGNNLNNEIIGNTGDNALYGNSGNDTLIGGEGNDYLNGGSGADAMQGNTGDDTYIVENSGDVVTELADEGTDTVNSSISYTLTDNVENLNLTGYSSTSGTGNDLDNTIVGNNASNTLRGLEGDDTLIGNGGHDTLDGGTGADSMSGGTGND